MCKCVCRMRASCGFVLHLRLSPKHCLMCESLLPVSTDARGSMNDPRFIRVWINGRNGPNGAGVTSTPDGGSGGVVVTVGVDDDGLWVWRLAALATQLRYRSAADGSMTTTMAKSDSPLV